MKKPDRKILTLLMVLMIGLALSACSDDDPNKYLVIAGERLGIRVEMGDSQASILARSPVDSFQSEERPEITYFFNDPRGELSWAVEVCPLDEQVIGARVYNVPDSINLATLEGVSIRTTRDEMFEILGTPDITVNVEVEGDEDEPPRVFSRHIYLTPIPGDDANNQVFVSFWYPLEDTDKMFFLRTATTAHACNDPELNGITSLVVVPPN
ncbi:MAG: hypothetical protein AAF267_11290 [Deinococcota bacterium]